MDGTPNELHQLAKFAYLLLPDAIVDGVALDEVLLQDTVGPLAELNTALAFHSIAYRSNHFKVEIVYLVRLRFSFNCTMLSGIRKFCDYHRIR